jgi:hypothetical protein
LPTPPGTLTNVTPLSEVPIIPKATNAQLLLRFPMKKDSLLALREVNQATSSKTRKYAITKLNKTAGDMTIRFRTRYVISGDQIKKFEAKREAFFEMKNVHLPMSLLLLSANTPGR